MRLFFVKLDWEAIRVLEKDKAFAGIFIGAYRFVDNVVTQLWV